MPGITITDNGVLEKVADNLANLPALVADATELSLDALGRTVQGHMQAQLEANRYKGNLINSVQYEVNLGNKSVTIGPTLKRGKYDAGTLLELGTKPIPNAPWKPIKAWADFRGIPAFPVWYKIKTKGVSPHPYLNQTLKRSEGAISRAAAQIGTVVAEAIVGGTP